MVKTKYDYIIPLGEKCFTAQTLQMLRVRKQSYPFDWLDIWVDGTGGKLSDRLDMILDDFRDWFNAPDLNAMFDGNYRFFVNCRNNLGFRHDFLQEDVFKEKFPHVAEKYARRVARFMDTLASGKRVLLVYASSVFELGDRAKIIQQMSALNKKFNTNKIDLLAIDSDRTLKRQNKIKIEPKQGNVTFVSGVDVYKALSDLDPEYVKNTMAGIINSVAKYDCIMPRVIVSLTSFPARMSVLPRVINSLINQTCKPDKIVLYLVKQEWDGIVLSDELSACTSNPVFEIRWTDADIRSYNKLIHALHDFADDIIITVDDDIDYPKFLVRDLLRVHRRRPNDICAHRVRRIKIKDGQVAPYREWTESEKRRFMGFRFRRGYRNFFCGVGGVLYPPRALSENVFRTEQFKTLCKHQDDVWFWAMALRNNVQISVTPFGYNMRKRTIDQVQSVGLWHTVNSNAISPNNAALANVIEKYPMIANRIGLRRESGLHRLARHLGLISKK